MGVACHMSRLNEDTQWLVQQLFAPAEQAEVEHLLETQCGASVYDSNVSTDDIDRVNFAALKYSEGDIGRFRQAIKTGQSDFRDLLGPWFASPLLTLRFTVDGTSR